MKIILLVIIAFLIVFLTGCGGGGGGSETEKTVVIQTEAMTIPEPTSIVMYCDSLGLTYKDGLTWLDMFGDLVQEDIFYSCQGGIKIRDYPIDDRIEYLGTHHKYAILALGVNDFQLSIIETLNIYEDFLIKIDETGMEAVCFTYPTTAALSEYVAALNEGIETLCSGRKVIHAAPQIVDYIHFSDEGRMNTAIDAARLLYP